MDDAVRFEGVRKGYGGREVLRGLTLRVRPGEVCALLGRNGAGKTTALRVLLGFLEPDAGASFLLGESSRDLSPSARGRVGYVAEGQTLPGRLRVRDALAIEAWTREGYDAARAEHDLRRLGLALDHRVGALSRGQRTQLALVLALAARPEALVLDDPAMGLDVHVRRELLESLVDLIGEDGRSVLFSSHILGDVERVADRIAILRDGALIVDAPLDDLKRRLERRHARADAAWDPGAEPLPGLVRARRTRSGWELLLLDVDPLREQRLRARLGVLSDPSVPDLEELFVDLTSADAHPPAELPA